MKRLIYLALLLKERDGEQLKTFQIPFCGDKGQNYFFLKLILEITSLDYIRISPFAFKVMHLCPHLDSLISPSLASVNNNGNNEQERLVSSQNAGFNEQML